MMIFFAVYVFVNIGLIARLYFALRDPGVAPPVRLGVCLLAFAWALALPLSRLIEGNGWGAKALAFTGAFWLSLVLHALLAWGALALARGMLGIFRLSSRRHFRRRVIAPERRAYWRQASCAAIAGAALLLSTVGWVNTQYPVARKVELPAPAGAAPLRIAALSDTHLGRLASPEFFARVVDEIEPFSPDIVVFAGDILEYDFDPSDVEATAAVLRRLNPRLGIWGVLGNHEYIGGRVELNKRMLRQIGIRILIDEEVELEGKPGEKILLIGRDDLSGERSTRRKRKTLDEIMARTPKTTDAPISILLDHQPWHLEEAESAGISLQFSGHTHDGQLFPLNLIVAALYENAYGHSTRGQTHYWVSSGAGTAGPRVRTSGRAEVVLIDLVARQGR
ncbi:MAG: metallophosphoesterase [Zoogloeaceae bacterium]|nr:metallophosphoesterase [Zoogloeaceae bacterium]